MAADTLREKLAKLVEEWRPFDAGPLYVCNKCGYCGETSEHDGCGYLAAFAPSLLTKLAAILAEPCACDDPYCAQHGQPKPKPLITPTGGVVLVPNPGQTHYVGDDCPGGHVKLPEAPQPASACEAHGTSGLTADAIRRDDAPEVSR